MWRGPHPPQQPAANSQIDYTKSRRLRGERAPAERPSQEEARISSTPGHPPGDFLASSPNRERLLKAAERSGLIFFQWEPDRSRLALSESCKDLLGYSSEEFAADPGLWTRVVDPASLNSMNAAVETVRKGHAASAQDVVHVRARGGRELWLSCVIFPVRGPSGNFVTWDGVAMDATEIVAARKAAEEAREFFRVIFEEGPMPLLLYDPSTLVVEQANARASQLYGMREGELKGCFLSELVAPDEWARTQEHFGAEGNRPGVSFLQRTRHRKADGTLVPVEVAGVNVEVDGKRRRIVVMRDLTDIDEANERIKGMHRALEATLTPTVVFDASWTVTSANPAFLQLTGLQPEGLSGREFTSLIDPAAQLALEQHAADLHRGKPFEGEGGLRMKNGEVRRVRLSVTPAVLSGERASTYFASFREAAPEAASGPQSPADAALFLDLLAHDVTNYLTAVRGYVELIMASGELPPSSTRMAQVAMAQANNALELIRDTRTVAALQRDPLQALAQGDLVGLLDEAIVRIEPLIRTRAFKVRKDYRVQEAKVQNPDLMREVFVNLLHNAVKFDQHAAIIIDVLIEKSDAHESPSFRVRIADRGAGIAEGDKARLFQRGFKPTGFVRREESVLTPQGSGIGLSLCKFIVERAGGTIAAESRIPGDHTQGTAFIVTVPSA